MPSHSGRLHPHSPSQGGLAGCRSQSSHHHKGSTLGSLRDRMEQSQRESLCPLLVHPPPCPPLPLPTLCNSPFPPHLLQLPNPPLHLVHPQTPPSPSPHLMQLPPALTLHLLHPHYLVQHLHTPVSPLTMHNFHMAPKSLDIIAVVPALIKKLAAYGVLHCSTCHGSPTRVGRGGSLPGLNATIRRCLANGPWGR